MTHDQGGDTEDVKQHDDCLQVDVDAEGANGEVIEMDRTLEMALHTSQIYLNIIPMRFLSKLYGI